MDEIDEIMSGLSYTIRDKFSDGQSRVRADDDTIRNFEALIGCELPADYRAFLGRYGGVYLANCLSVPQVQDPRLGLDPEEGTSVEFFLGFYTDSHKSTSNDLAETYRNTIGKFPAGTVPIAESGDNLYCLSCLGKSTGHVYLCLPGQFDGDDRWDLFLVASSFTSFLRSLFTLSEEDARDRYG